MNAAPNAVGLSVCICTFNRADYVGATLESIVTQATDAVEIVVVDGGTDGTDAIVAQWQERFPRLRYRRQSVNGGFDRDLATALDLAEGRYLWMYSDDDPMKPGAIDVVLAHCAAGHALIVVNAEVRNRDLTHVLEPQRLRVAENRVYAASEMTSLFRDTADYLTFVGAIVLRRDLWHARRKEQWFGTMFIHTAVVFEAPLQGSAYVLAAPQVVIRYGQAMWSPRAFDIWMFRWPELVWSLPFPEEAKQRVTAREPWRRWRNLLLHRAMGSYGKEEYARLAPALRGVSSWISRLIAILPPRMLNLTLTIAALLILRRRSTTLTDLRNSRYAPFRRA